MELAAIGPASEQLLELTSLSIGVWRARKSKKVYLLPLPEKSKFVFLVEQLTQRKPSVRLRKRISHAVKTVLDVKSPFTPEQHITGGWVVGFEVEWSDVRGIDYLNPLLEHGRFVIEATKIAKSEFPTLMSAIESYHEGCIPPMSQLTTQPVSLKVDEKSTTSLSPSPFLQVNARSLNLPDVNTPSDLSSIYESLNEEEKEETPREEGAVDLQSEGSFEEWLSGSDTSEPVTPTIDFKGCNTVYQHRTIVVNFKDPKLPQRLAPCFKDDMRMLKLLEAGLPSWAVFMGSYGFWYRPWMRTMTWLIFVMFSIFSLACGFYDLYMHVPFLKNAIRAVIDSINLPATDIFEWLERHALMRLSILLTYLFGKSPLFMTAIRTCQNAWKVTVSCCGPVLSPFAYLMGQLASTMMFAWSYMASGGMWILECSRIATKPILDFLALLSASIKFILLPFAQLAVVPINLAIYVWSMLLYGAMSMGQCIKSIWQVASTFWVTTKTLTRAGRKIHASTGGSNLGQISWFYAVPADAYKVLEVSFLKVLKGTQAIVRGCAYAGSAANRHRLSLTIRMRHRWARARRRWRRVGRYIGSFGALQRLRCARRSYVSFDKILEDCSRLFSETRDECVGSEQERNMGPKED